MTPVSHSRLETTGDLFGAWEILSHLPNGVLITNVEGKISFCNDRAATLLDQERGALIGREISDCASKAAGIFLQTFVFPMLLREERVSEVFLNFRDVNGADIPISLNANRIEHEGTTHFIWSLFSAENRHQLEKELVAARKYAEEALVKSVDDAEEIKRINEALDDFAYIASHDLKEPMRGVAFNADLLCREELTGSGQERAQRIVTLCKRMDRQVSDLLFYSRLSRTPTSKDVVDPAKVIGEIVADLKEFIDDNSATITIKMALPEILAAEPMVQTVFRNLIVNAIKYNNNPHKQISIGFSADVKVNGEVRENSFYVRDNGIGIIKKDQKKIFEIFKRLNNKDDSGSGSGSGLSFVKKIINDYGYSVDVQSAPNKGSTFFVSFPLAP